MNPEKNDKYWNFGIVNVGMRGTTSYNNIVPVKRMQKRKKKKEEEDIKEEYK